MKKWFLIVLFFALRLQAAELPDYTRFGTLQIVRLASASFPHRARAEGHVYQGQAYPADEHYHDNSVAYFVPRGFRATGRIDVIVHFHGWRNHVEKVLRQYQLIEQLTESQRNAILVVPQGPRDAPDSFGGKLEDEKGFRRFMEELRIQLQGQAALKEKDFQWGRIILSGHSGGYRVMAAILDRGGLTGQIEEVWLFDGLYGQVEKFLAWTELKRGRFINVYTEKGGTKEESEQMLKSLADRGQTFLKAREGEVGASELKTSRLSFLFSELGHDQVIEGHRTFKLFLETSCFHSISE